MGLFGSLGSYLEGRSARKEFGNAQKRGLGVIDEMQNADRLRLGQSQRALEGQIPTIQTGYRLARKDVGGAFRGAQTGAVEQGNVAAGNAISRFTNSGYSGASSIAANLRAGIGYGTSRAIQGIQDRVAQIAAGLDTGEAQDVAGAQGRLSSFFLQRAAFERDPLMAKFALLTKQRPPRPWAALGSTVDAGAETLASVV